jgi:HD superfamily phosphohydrolase
LVGPSEFPLLPPSPNDNAVCYSPLQDPLLPYLGVQELHKLAPTPGSVPYEISTIHVHSVARKIRDNSTCAMIFVKATAMQSKRLRIPNVDVRLSAHEIAVTQTRQFQRLFFLRQLGLAYLVYPAATHTRATHSIQCLHETSQILRAIDVADDSEEGKAVRMAALLHDIGHVPFSHTLEDEHLILPKHDRSERLGNALSLLKTELDPATQRMVDLALPILTAISASDDSTRDWRSDTVGNTVCADLLAYISTDAAMTGIEKRPGYYRIYEYFTREKNRLCIKLTKGGLRTDIVSCVMDLLDMRYALTERVIFHHAKCVARAMLARAARLCRLTDSPELLQMGDELFLSHLFDTAATLHLPGCEKIINSIRSRRLFQRIFKVGRTNRDAWDEAREPGAFCDKWRNGENVEKLLAYVEETHQLPQGTLALWCPEGRAGMKLAKANVVWDSADKGLQGPAMLRDDRVSRQFPGVAKRVRTIEDQYSDLWTFWIAMDREYVSHAAPVVRTIESEIGISCDPVFRETYLKQIPGFHESSQRNSAVEKVFREIEPEVEEVLEQTSFLDGRPHIDDSTIRGAIKSVVNKEPLKKNKSSELQEKLFDPAPQPPEKEK